MIFIRAYLHWQRFTIVSILHFGCVAQLLCNSLAHELPFADFQSIGFFIVPNAAALEEKWRWYSS